VRSEPGRAAGAQKEADSVNWLLLLIPAAIALEFLAPGEHSAIFITSGLAIVPLAGWMGRATEHLAERFGEGIGGLLNATFGNAAEMIIAIAALRAGHFEIVKASIAGSIIGNILLVLGAAMLAGGLRRKEQRYNAPGARSQASLLTIAAIALVLPAAYRTASGGVVIPEIGPLSLAIAIVLLVIYALNLWYSLRSHRELFAGEAREQPPEAEAHAPWSIRKSGLILGAATVGVAAMSELLVGAVEPAAEAMGLNDAFVGVFVVAILGNAAEHATAITAAMKDRMDLSLSIAIGSSVQIALFVAPILVILSYAIAPAPMDLAFSGGLVTSVLLSVLILGQVAGDGRSDWLRGAQLLGVYALLAIAYFFIPAAP